MERTHGNVNATCEIEDATINRIHDIVDAVWVWNMYFLNMSRIVLTSSSLTSSKHLTTTSLVSFCTFSKFSFWFKNILVIIEIFCLDFGRKYHSSRLFVKKE